MSENRILKQVRLLTLLLATIAMFFTFQTITKLTFRDIPFPISINALAPLLSLIIVFITTLQVYRLFIEHKNRRDYTEELISAYFENQIDESVQENTADHGPDIVFKTDSGKYIAEFKLSESKNEELLMEIAEEIQKGNVEITKMEEDE